jgi:hypothetical protein
MQSLTSHSGTIGIPSLDRPATAGGATRDVRRNQRGRTTTDLVSESFIMRSMSPDGELSGGAPAAIARAAIGAASLDA